MQYVFGFVYRKFKYDNSSDEEELKTPDSAPSKRSKMQQFKTKDKLRLIGSGPKPKPLDIKAFKRKIGEEAVVQGTKLLMLMLFKFISHY